MTTTEQGNITMAKKTEKKTDNQDQKERDKKLEDQKKQAALTDYEKRLANVKKLKKLTDTEAWQQLYKSMQKTIANHAESLLDHKLTSKDVIYHQQGVRVLRDLLNRMRAPMDALASFEKDMPLFAPGEIKEHATWDGKTGRVILK
jgi:Skp family chaperone for outer membrane proteins